MVNWVRRHAKCTPKERGRAWPLSPLPLKRLHQISFLLSLFDLKLCSVKERLSGTKNNVKEWLCKKIDPNLGVGGPCYIRNSSRYLLKEKCAKNSGGCFLETSNLLILFCAKCSSIILKKVFWGRKKN